MSVMLEIKNCEGCPRVNVTHARTADSFETIFIWHCSENGRRVATLDWNDPTPDIPDWCPLRK